MCLSPSHPYYLDPEDKDNQAAKDHPVSKSFHWVNIQTYSGSANPTNTVDSWINLAFTTSQLTYGILPETTDESDESSPPIKGVQDALASQQLGGINAWRLTGNYLFSNIVQVLMYNHVCNTTLHDSPDLTTVEALWKAGTRGQRKLK